MTPAAGAPNRSGFWQLTSQATDVAVKSAESVLYLLVFQEAAF